MTVLSGRLIRIGGVLAVAAVALAVIAGVEMQRTAHADPQSTIDTFIVAVNAGEATAAANTFAENGYLLDIGNEGFGIFGRAAIQGAFATEFSNEGIHVTLIDSTVKGATVMGNIELSSNATNEAGVTRIIQPFAARVLNDRMEWLRLTYEESDPQTAQFLQFQASQPDDGDPTTLDAMQMPLAGTQPGQALTGTFDDLRFVGIEITPAAIDRFQPAAIHMGSCATPGAAVQQLAPVVSGSSTSLTSLTLADLDGRILVVTATENDSAVVACGVFADLELVQLSPVSPVMVVDTGSGGPSAGELGAVLMIVAGALALISVTMLALGIRRPT